MNQKTKVMMVDDNAPYLRMLSANLKSAGFEVLALTDPNGARKAAREFAPDVMLLDVVMPQQDGGDLYNTLRADPAFKRLPILFVTAAVTAVTRNNGMVFVPKPVKMEVLLKEMQAEMNAMKAG